MAKIYDKYDLMSEYYKEEISRINRKLKEGAVREEGINLFDGDSLNFQPVIIDFEEIFGSDNPDDWAIDQIKELLTHSNWQFEEEDNGLLIW